ncbi:MAG: hypothetical protein ISR52_09370 [Rhodospirillales bacterium]|nr:hypothetical protein [Rhodospirillales bacterium]
MAFPAQVKFVDVAARDGLQNEPGRVSTETKIELIERLASAGVPVIEAGIDLTAMIETAWFICGALGREPASKAAHTLREKALV